jgi:sec-independent protein translocase protein TatA
MLGNIGTSELLIIFLIILVFFGAKKIPDLASGLGKGIRSFKKALNTDEETNSETTEKKKEIKE